MEDMSAIAYVYSGFRFPGAGCGIRRLRSGIKRESCANQEQFPLL